MPKYKFDFELNIWLQGVEIDAVNEEEALDILHTMDAEDLIYNGYVKDYEVKNLDIEEEEDYE